MKYPEHQWWHQREVLKAKKKQRKDDIYGNEKIKASRRPDFRHTMYWEPSVTGKTGTEFYTSDLEGIYVATLQGVDADGKRIEVKWEFEVR